MDDSIDSGNFSVRGYLPLLRQDFVTHMHGLAIYEKEELLFAWISRKLFHWPSSCLCTVFDAISSNTDEVLSNNLPAVFVFGDFNVHDKDWLTCSGGTDRPSELFYNFSISNDLTQIVNFPSRIPDCDSHSPPRLDLFISSDASICSTMVFPSFGNFDHIAVSVSIDFPSDSKGDASFYCIAYDYFCAD